VFHFNLRFTGHRHYLESLFPEYFYDRVQAAAPIVKGGAHLQIYVEVDSHFYENPGYGKIICVSSFSRMFTVFPSIDQSVEYFLFTSL
jgi:hypothetical protein